MLQTTFDHWESEGQQQRGWRLTTYSMEVKYNRQHEPRPANRLLLGHIWIRSCCIEASNSDVQHVIEPQSLINQNQFRVQVVAIVRSQRVRERAGDLKVDEGTNREDIQWDAWFWCRFKTTAARHRRGVYIQDEANIQSDVWQRHQHLSGS